MARVDAGGNAIENLFPRPELAPAKRAYVRAPVISRSGKPVAFYIRKMVNGRSVWLKRMAPAIVWGPKSQAMPFASKGAARLILQNIPRADQAEVMAGDESDPKP